MKELLKNTGLLYGVCDFNEIKNGLLNVKSKKHLPENAKSVIVFAFPYNVKNEKPKNISRYSAVADYHTVVKGFLKNIILEAEKKYPENTFVPFCDSSPIPEVTAGVKAGLGKRGKNGLLITEKYGSYIFLGEIVTDLKLPAEQKAERSCSNCGLCKKHCPQNSIDRQKQIYCLSAITQKKGDLTNSEILALKKGKSAWGCDICQEICPENKGKTLSEIKDFISSYRAEFKSGDEIENRAFAWRGKQVIERNLQILKDIEND